VFAYPVADPERYGVAEFDAAARAVASRKSRRRRSRATRSPGSISTTPRRRRRGALEPSARGELEITDVNRRISNGRARVRGDGRGMAWLDTGTHESLLEASQYIETIERRQGLKIACPEEIAYRQGYIDAARLEALGQALAKNAYGRYLLALLHDPLLRDPVPR
jgi:glucose-1-phosphate thymidylyltransferase